MKKNMLLFLIAVMFQCTYGQNDYTPEMQFRNDSISKNIHIYILGGIAARPQQGDDEFEKAYGIHFYDFGCLAPGNLDFYSDYNLLVFGYLSRIWGTAWQEQIRKDVLGWNKWQK